MKVKVIYRNYIPLYSTYSSFWLAPMEGIEFIIPEPKPKLKKLYKIYRAIGSNFILRILLKIVQKIIFDSKVDDEADFLFYVGMLPEENIKKPYIIDLEHPGILFNGLKPTEGELKRVLKIFTNKLCKGIVPWSKAAVKVMKIYFGKDYKKFEKKVKVVYPALPSYKKLYKGQEDYSLLGKKGKKFRICFVAGLGEMKGLEELLQAFTVLSKKYKNIELIVVTNSKELVAKYQNNKKIKFFEAKFAQSDIVKKVFLTSDIFIMPTYVDTFGMVFLEAMSAGLPVILTRQFATPEMIVDGVHGKFIKHGKLYLDNEIYPRKDLKRNDFIKEEDRPQVVEELVEKISYFADNSKKLKQMGRNAEKLFEKGGKFSLTERNRILEKIFKS